MMEKSNVYLEAQTLAQDLTNSIDHPRAIGTIAYDQEAQHRVCMHIFIKDEALSQGKKIISVIHDSELNEVTVFTHNDFHESVQERIIRFAKEVETPIQFFKPS